MAKRRVRKNTKKSASIGNNGGQDDVTLEKKEPAYQYDEVERQSAAIRALRDVEIDQLLTMIRLLRSYFSQEQLQVPVLQFFKENLQNLTIAGGHGQCDVQWKDADGNLTLNQADERNIHTSLLHRLSVAYPDLSTGIPSLGGFEFSNKSVKTVPFSADSLQIRSLVLEGGPDSQAYELKNCLQTPDVCILYMAANDSMQVSNNRLSVGMTPKTLRLPKDGEMLLSVHGSPLGVYKEDNMETIQGIGGASPDSPPAPSDLCLWLQVTKRRTFPLSVIGDRRDTRVIRALSPDVVVALRLGKTWLHQLAPSVVIQKEDKIPPRRNRFQGKGETSHAGNLSHGPENLKNPTSGSKCELLDDCRKLFDEIAGRDTVTWNIILSGFSGTRNQDDKVMGLFSLLRCSHDPKPSPVTLAIVLPIFTRLGCLATGFAENKLVDKAFELFVKMIEGLVIPNYATIANMLPVCAAGIYFGRDWRCQKVNPQTGPNFGGDPSVRQVSFNGVCMRTTIVEARLDEGNIQEAESALRDGFSLNFEEARALLIKLEYQRGNVEGALRVFEGIDLQAAIQRMQHSFSDKQPSRKIRSRNEAVYAVSQHGTNVVLGVVYLKAKSLQKLGKLTETAQECQSVLDAVEKIFDNGIPDVMVENKRQVTVSHAVELLPELWKQAGCFPEAISAYHRALLSQWNLDNECCARIQKAFALFLLYGGVEANPPSLDVQVEGSCVPKSNLEEAILLLMFLMRKFYLGNTSWDPSVLEHLSFAITLQQNFCVGKAT
ncbi:tetratricopeptide repeat protein 7A [Dorcoceras hygrometricum]|nr:tetratricopeptide repeat protein 7A [Dorcoceras hygrometricum]